MKWVFPFIIFVGCLLSCEKQQEETPPDEKYDLFPLNVGNKFYYSYGWISQFLTASSFQYGYGNEVWKILSMSNNSDTSIEYNFQLISYNIVDIEVINTPPDTLIRELNEDTRYFTLLENPVSGEIRFNPNPIKNWQNFNISFQRYSDTQKYIFHVPGIPYAYKADWQFAADSGLIHGSFRLVSHHTKSYSLVLDSLNLVQ
jgi:hypothetical protein